MDHALLYLRDYFSYSGLVVLGAGLDINQSTKRMSEASCGLKQKREASQLRLISFLRTCLIARSIKLLYRSMLS